MPFCVVTVTVDDPDDSIGIGDNSPANETGIIPTITAVSDPTYNSLIGQTFLFSGQFNADGDISNGYEYFWAVIGGNNTIGGNFFLADKVPGTLVVGQTAPSSAGSTSVPEAEGIPVMTCFVSGTLIKTRSGEVPIETLTAGDLVLTMDHGYQPIRWIGSSKRPATGDIAPIQIRKGALGNDRDLRVSPQHRMLLQGGQAELLFGETAALATAKSLVNDHSIIRVEGGEVEYFHMLFDTHEIIYAEGAPSESFHPGEQGWKALDEPTRNALLELFPELSDGDFSNYGPSARVSLKHKEGQLLGQYMLQENQVNEGNPYA